MPADPAALARLTPQFLLDAMEGVAYVVGETGTILAVGRHGWTEFARHNQADGLAPDRVIGASLFDMFLGDEVRNVYRRLHDSVRGSQRRQIVFDYRCDAPETARHMRMSIGRIADGDRLIALLYQSQLLRAVARVPIPMFASEMRLPRGKPADDKPIVTLCSYCHVVAPAGADTSAAHAWMQPEDYYRAGHPAEIYVSHGICPDCYRRVVCANVGEAAV